MNQDIEVQIFRSNVAIHSSSSPTIYGDGSLEVEGRIYVDDMVNYTPNNGINIEDTIMKQGSMLLSPLFNANVPATSGKATLFYDQTTNRLRIKYPNGQLNPVLTNKGGIVSHDGTNETILNVPSNSEGYSLVVDTTQPTGLAWKAAPPTKIASLYYVHQSSAETSTTATVFVTKTTWSVTLSQGTYRMGLFYNWRMSAGNRMFKCRLIDANNVVYYEHNEHASGNGTQTQDAKQIGSGVFFFTSSGQTSTFRLQFATENNVSAFLSNVVIEALQVS